MWTAGKGCVCRTSDDWGSHGARMGLRTGVAPWWDARTASDEHGLWIGGQLRLGGGGNK